MPVQWTAYAGRVQPNDGYQAASHSLLAGTVVAPQNNERPLIVTEAFGQKIQAYRVQNGTQVPGLVWSVAGRGMVSGSSAVATNNAVASIAAYDPAGQGKLPSAAGA